MHLSIQVVVVREILDPEQNIYREFIQPWLEFLILLYYSVVLMHYTSRFHNVELGGILNLFLRIMFCKIFLNTLVRDETEG